MPETARFEVTATFVVDAPNDVEAWWAVATALTECGEQIPPWEMHDDGGRPCVTYAPAASTAGPPARTGRSY